MKTDLYFKYNTLVENPMVSPTVSSITMLPPVGKKKPPVTPPQTETFWSNGIFGGGGVNVVFAFDTWGA